MVLNLFGCPIPINIVAINPNERYVNARMNQTFGFLHFDIGFDH